LSGKFWNPPAASIADVSPNLLSSRRKWRVEVFLSSPSSVGALARVEYRIRALGAASSMPVGSPSRPRTIWPPLGSGVSLVKPAALSAARFRTADWYRCRTNTGVSGAAAFSSATVGSRRSANCSADHPDPLALGSAGRLLTQHRQPLTQTAHAVPAQFEHVVETPADHVQMGVVEARDHPSSECVHHLCVRADVAGHVPVVADDRDDTVPDAQCLGVRSRRVSGVDPGIADDQIGGVGGGMRNQPADGHC
jgi:hypothetical protein